MHRSARARLLALAVALLVAAAWFVLSHGGPGQQSDAGPSPTAAYIGSAACATCHAQPSAAWQTSQHAAAMAHASDETVLGRFDDVTVREGVGTLVFRRRDGRFFVDTDGPDGRRGTFEITYTFGIAPLQQYLVALPGGRLQTLTVAWDTRPVEAGGQRWLPLYPDEPRRAGDRLHWTGLDQNWNFMCADCHSTNVRKGYDPRSRTFQTAWSEISVGCEACHGPGSAHAAWAQANPRTRAGEPAARSGSPARPDGLTVALDERRGVTWRIDTATGAPARSEPRTTAVEIEVCARCHARRSQLTDVARAGDRLDTAFRASLLQPGLYFPDGQQRDEVYTYGSFLQSRMHEKGVTCSDCHDPHTGRTRAAGDALCLQCHAPGTSTSASHAFHPVGAAGATCVACHMPTRTYMRVDPRHDHSFRIPRPDRTVSLGVPNACTEACHRGRSPSWAAAVLASRGGSRGAGYQTFAEAFASADRGDAGSAAGLLGVLLDAGQSAMARASAAERLARSGQAVDGIRAASLLRDPSALVRAAVLQTLQHGDPGARLQLAAPLLSDTARTVRAEAVRALADVPADLRPAAYAAALDEYLAGEAFNADRPEAQVNRGTVLLQQSRVDEAVAAFQEALRLDPAFTSAAINLSDAYRGRQDEASSERVLRDALTRTPSDAAVHHALGLSLVRQRRPSEAVQELAAAVRLAPDVARYAFVHAVALHDTGRAAEALAALTSAIARLASRPDPDLLSTAALYSEEAGQRAQARVYAQRLLALTPSDPNAQALAARLK